MSKYKFLFFKVGRSELIDVCIISIVQQYFKVTITNQFGP